ncbi:MAG: hypothetical protein WD794_08080 [Mycobacteriales bacterium]
MTGDSGPRDLAELAGDLGEDGVGLLSAGSVDELRRLLLSAGPRRSSCVDAELLLRTHHGTAPGALDTARLLLTDRRWERLSGKLVHGLVRTGLLTDEDLDALALELLADEWLVYRAEDVFTGGISVELPGPDRLDDGPDDDTPAADGQLVALRYIPPPLRRWAAARAVRRSLLSAPDLFALLNELPARAAGETVRGMVDELETLPADEGEQLLETALGWPAKAVRVAALDRLIERGDPERAARLAADDADQSVRDRVGRRTDQESLF